MLLDSNIVIYSYRPEYPQLRQLIDTADPKVSAISYVEVLGYHSLTEADRIDFEDFFAGSVMIQMTDDILDRAVRLRQTRKMGLGDAIIAATALIHSLQLVTRNTSDFDWIEGLRLLNPLDP